MFMLLLGAKPQLGHKCLSSSVFFTQGRLCYPDWDTTLLREREMNYFILLKPLLFRPLSQHANLYLNKYSFPLNQIQRQTPSQYSILVADPKSILPLIVFSVS